MLFLVQAVFRRQATLSYADTPERGEKEEKEETEREGKGGEKGKG